jgi:hypothetical protein
MKTRYKVGMCIAGLYVLLLVCFFMFERSSLGREILSAPTSMMFRADHWAALDTNPHPERYPVQILGGIVNCAILFVGTIAIGSAISRARRQK